MLYPDDFFLDFLFLVFTAATSAEQGSLAGRSSSLDLLDPFRDFLT
jgi:hypothetical protein